MKTWHRWSCYVGIWVGAQLSIVAAMSGHWSRWVYVLVGAAATTAIELDVRRRKAEVKRG